MRKFSAKPIRLRNLDKNKPREQQSPKQNDPASKASNYDHESNKNKRQINQHPTSEYGIRQEVSGSHIVRRRLGNLLEERFPGRWSIIEVCAHLFRSSKQAVKG